MEIKLSSLAEIDLEEISGYLDAYFPAKSESTYNVITGYFEMLTQYPRMGKMNTATKTRELKISNLPYFIIYKEYAKTLVILRIYHTSRNPSAF